MPDRVQPPFRADHIGSLKRPENVIAAKQAFFTGKVSGEELEQIEKEAIRSVVELQKRAGIKAITDGEYRRTVFFNGFFEKLGGMEVLHNLPLGTVKPLDVTHQAFRGKLPSSVSAPMVVGKIKRVQPIYLSEFEYVKSLVDESEVGNIKITMCGPLWYDFRYGEEWIRTDVYTSRAELIADIAAVYRAEIADLYAAGCRNIQIDEPGMTYLCYPPIREAFLQEGTNPDDILEGNIACINACLQDVPKDMTVGIHLCRGNFRGKHIVEGAYTPIAERLLTKLNVTCFYLEYDTERAGGFEPLVHLPKDKVAVLGLISTKVPELEPVELLVDRVQEAAQTIQDAHPERTREEVLDQLCISPQCGFASDMFGNPVTQEDMENKLKLTVEVSKRIWSY